MSRNGGVCCYRTQPGSSHLPLSPLFEELPAIRPIPPPYKKLFGLARATRPALIQSAFRPPRGMAYYYFIYPWPPTLGPAPINSGKRPQADISVSRPVSTQFCFYPLRIIPQGTQSEGLRMRSDFGGVESSMFLAQYEIYKSGGASGKSHQVLL